MNKEIIIVWLSYVLNDDPKYIYNKVGVYEYYNHFIKHLSVVRDLSEHEKNKYVSINIYKSLRNLAEFSEIDTLRDATYNITSNIHNDFLIYINSFSQ